MRIKSNELLGELCDLDDLIRRCHRNHIPRADLSAQRTSDASRQINVTVLHDGLKLGAGHSVNAIHRTYGHACLATGAKVLIKNRQSLG